MLKIAMNKFFKNEKEGCLKGVSSGFVDGRPEIDTLLIALRRDSEHEPVVY